MDPAISVAEGEAYRDERIEQARRLGVADSVTFDPRYYDKSSLAELIQQASVVVLPYDSTEQVTSGVLIEAVGAEVPVVATEFPHAVELLVDGPGLLVPHQDPAAMASAIRRLLAEPDTTSRLTGLTGGPTLRWPAVAARYQALAGKLLAARTPAAAASVPA